MKVITNNDFPFDVPFECPKCGIKSLYISGIDAWETETGKPLECSIECKSEPDIEEGNWWNWFNWHYEMPYVDWLPLQRKVLKWLQKNYRVQR